jgi:DNA-binding transcriptional MocR family regulator
MADWLSDRSIGKVTADDIVLTPGGQSAITIALQCCLRGERPAVFVEELAYPGFRHAARLSRAEVVPVALDDQGMRADALHAACRRHAGQVVCLTTEAQNPTTVRMTPERRAEIVAVARLHDLQVVEDDCYAPSANDIPALRAAAPERTWYVSSLSKSIAAGLRLGAITCPTGNAESARLAAQHNFFGLSRLVIDVVLDLIASGEAHRLKLAVRAEIDTRLEIALNALGRHRIGWQKGLSFIWIPMPAGWCASTFAREAAAAGLPIRQADEYALPDGRAPNAVRVALSGSVPADPFAEAMATLARLLDASPRELAV